MQPTQIGVDLMGNEATKPESLEESRPGHVTRSSHIPDIKDSQAKALLEVIREINSEKVTGSSIPVVWMRRSKDVAVVILSCC